MNIAAALLIALHWLDGTPVSTASSNGTALLFWRADCPPCVVELRSAADYIAAAEPGRVIFVGLQDDAAVRAAAARFSLPADAVAKADGAAVTALPMAVILGPAGQVCFRHAGLLGTETLRRHMASCGGGGAGR